MMRHQSNYDNEHLSYGDNPVKKFIGALVRLLPKKIQWFVYRSLLLERTKQKEQTTPPTIELPNRCISNLQILVDRQVLLEKLPTNGIVAEIGVDKGEFSREILELNSPEKLYLIDMWNSKLYPAALQDLVSSAMENEKSSGRVEMARGMSFEKLTEFKDEFFDWVYIDTDHSYQTTKKELEAAAPKMKPGGYICGHDYAIVNWIGGELYGVIQAVNEFCVTNNWEMIYLTNESHRNLSFAIRKVKTDSST